MTFLFTSKSRSAHFDSRHSLATRASRKIVYVSLMHTCLRCWYCDEASRFLETSINVASRSFIQYSNSPVKIGGPVFTVVIGDWCPLSFSSLNSWHMYCYIQSFGILFYRVFYDWHFQKVFINFFSLKIYISITSYSFCRLSIRAHFSLIHFASAPWIFFFISFWFFAVFLIRSFI